MAKKKAKKSTKSKGSKKKSHGGLDGIEGLPADGLLLALLLQGKKQSLSYYYESYLEYKEQLKALRLRLHTIELSQYSTIKSIMKTSDEFTFEILDLNKGKEQFLASLNLDHDSLICNQRSEIFKLQQKIDELETVVEDLDDQIESIQQFQESDGFNKLQLEIQKANNDAEMAKERRRLHLERISSRHEQSLFLSSQKAQRILRDMEAVACKIEFQKLPPKAIEKMILNRLLKHQIEETKKDSENLETQIRNLEDKNIDYIFNGLEIDWNLMYHGGDQEIASDYKFDYNYSSDSLNIYSDIESIDGLLDGQRLENAFALPQKTLMHERVSDIDNIARKLNALELEKRYKNISDFGMKGDKIELKKPDLLTAGHLKFYDSKI